LLIPEKEKAPGKSPVPPPSIIISATKSPEEEKTI
jgi:hypothetical protein